MGTLPRPSRDHVLSDPAGTERYRPIFMVWGPPPHASSPGTLQQLHSLVTAARHPAILLYL